jgi:outer membrane protein TolC
MKRLLKFRSLLLLPVGLSISALLMSFTLSNLSAMSKLSTGDGKLSPPTENVLTFSLVDAVKKALTNSPSIKAGDYRTEKARLLTEAVRAKKFVPHLKLSIKTGVVPEARGDVLNSPDQQTDLEGLGPFYRLELQAVQPLFTFGRLPSAARAAGGAFKAQKAKAELDKQEFTLMVINAYWALRSAQEAQGMATKLQRDFKKLLNEVKKRSRDEDSDIDDSKLLEIQAESFSITETIESCNALLHTARQSFNGILGLDGSAVSVTAGEKTPALPGGCLRRLSEGQRAAPLGTPLALRAVGGEPGNDTILDSGLSPFLRSALQRHKGLEALEAAILATEAKIQMEAAEKKPMLYLGAGFKWSHAPNRDDQKNPFVYDNFNYLKVAAFLGLDWDLNHKSTNIAVKRLRMEKKAMEQDAIAVKTLLQVKIKKALEDVRKYSSLFDEAQKSLKTAKSWLRLDLDNWDMGLGNSESLLKAYKAYYKLQEKVIRYRFLTNTSMARLAYDMGDVNLYLEWIKNEKLNIN